MTFQDLPHDLSSTPSRTCGSSPMSSTSAYPSGIGKPAPFAS